MSERLTIHANGQWSLKKGYDIVPAKTEEVQKPQKEVKSSSKPKSLKQRLIVKDADFGKPIKRFKVNDKGEHEAADPSKPHAVWEQHPELGSLSYSHDGKGGKTNHANNYTVHLDDDNQTEIAGISVMHEPDLFGTVVGGGHHPEHEGLFNEALKAVEDHHKAIGRPFPSQEQQDFKAKLTRDKYFHAYNPKTGKHDPPAAEKMKDNFKSKPFKDFDKD